MTLSDYFLSPRGRIGRQEYWLGMLAMMAVTIIGASLIDPQGFTNAGGKVRPPSFAATVWSLLFAWPTTAVSIKRFNDRDWPWWLGFALGASMTAFVIANYNGYFLDPDGMPAIERLLMACAAVAFTWSLFENGFQRGTSGPNRYGPDPLDQIQGTPD